MIVLYLIILAITATVIVNTLVMAVFERTREIGILSALGMRSGRIMAMFFAESAMLALGGILIGLIIGGAMVAYFGSVGYYIGDYGVTGMLFSERIYAILFTPCEKPGHPQPRRPGRYPGGVGVSRPHWRPGSSRSKRCGAAGRHSY